MSEKQSYRDSDDMPTERAVLEREWKAMRLALSTPRAARAAQPGAVGLCEQICEAIKAADDKATDEAGYMLDSNDCIAIVRQKFAAAPTEAKPATQQASGGREALTEPGRDLIAGVLRCAAWTHDAVGAPALAKQAREALETFKRAALSMPAQQDAVDAAIPLDKDELAQLIAEHLGGTYHCTRVWEAWNVGTMRPYDFEPVDESETPTKIAEAIIDAIRAAISAKKGGAA